MRSLRVRTKIIKIILSSVVLWQLFIERIGISQGYVLLLGSSVPRKRRPPSPPFFWKKVWPLALNTPAPFPPLSPLLVFTIYLWASSITFECYFLKMNIANDIVENDCKNVLNNLKTCFIFHFIMYFMQRQFTQWHSL